MEVNNMTLQITSALPQELQSETIAVFDLTAKANPQELLCLNAFWDGVNYALNLAHTSAQANAPSSA